ncbi:MAG: MFS transporter, partial [Actinomycetota bacterium]
VAERAPAAGQGMIVTAARDAFMSGWMSASLVAAGIAVVGSMLTLVFLPNRAASHDTSSAAA